MLHIGCHLSVSAGYRHMGEEALALGADTFQFFTRNPRGGRAAAIREDDAAALAALMEAHRLAPVVAHAPYTLNPCGKEPRVRDFAESVLAEDLSRLSRLPVAFYNMHPGSHVGQGAEEGIALTAAALARALAGLPPGGRRPMVLLETMAGKGSEIGRTFEELGAIRDRAGLPGAIGFCLDTCHVFDAGYDIVNDLDGVLAHFDKVLGLENLRAVHLNDSLNPMGSRKDRHARIGEGHIGLEALVAVTCHPALRDLPFILETPNEAAGYAREIALLRERFEKCCGAAG